MSYIAFDLDALNRAPAVARAAGVSEESILAGLLRLWAWCFREELDQVTSLQVRGHFGAEVAEALAAFGFLEPTTASGCWRVRGAARYLKVKTAQRDAAKRTNQRRVQRTEEQRSSDAPPHAPAPGELTPLHRAPSTERGSMSSPLEQPRAPAEDENTRWDLAAQGFVDWARNQAPQLGDPGPQVLDWARTWFRKHQPDDLEVPRVAFASFVVWASLNGRTPGWGLWLEPAVWEPRCDDARLASRARRGGRAA